MRDITIVDLDGVLYRCERGLSDDAPLVEELDGGFPPGRGETCTLSVCRIMGWDSTGDQPVAWWWPMKGWDPRFAPIAAALNCRLWVPSEHSYTPASAQVAS